jgi:hypothetical protein
LYSCICCMYYIWYSAFSMDVLRYIMEFLWVFVSFCEFLNYERAISTSSSIGMKSKVSWWNFKTSPTNKTNKTTIKTNKQTNTNNNTVLYMQRVLCIVLISMDEYRKSIRFMKGIIQNLVEVDELQNQRLVSSQLSFDHWNTIIISSRVTPGDIGIM